jgi:hypothetical protein
MAKIKKQFDLNTIKRIVLLGIIAVLIGCLGWASLGWSLDQTSDYLYWLYGGDPAQQGYIWDNPNIAHVLSWIVQYGSIGFLAAASRARRGSMEWWVLVILGWGSESLDAFTNIGAFNLRELPVGRYDDTIGQYVGYGVCIIVARAEELLLWTLSYAAELIYEIGQETGAPMPKWLKSGQASQQPQERPVSQAQPVYSNQRPHNQHNRGGR